MVEGGGAIIEESNVGLECAHVLALVLLLFLVNVCKTLQHGHTNRNIDDDQDHTSRLVAY